MFDRTTGLVNEHKKLDCRPCLEYSLPVTDHFNDGSAQAFGLVFMYVCRRVSIWTVTVELNDLVT